MLLKIRNDAKIRKFNKVAKSCGNYLKLQFLHELYLTIMGFLRIHTQSAFLVSNLDKFVNYLVIV